jgi:broad specificity phosphatase PhoE
MQTKKQPLSIEGEKIADRISNNPEFKNLDLVWSSDYSRAMATAKYFAFKNNLKVNIDENLGERKHGVNEWSELPKDFEIRQLKDEEYKLPNGESRKEVTKRFWTALKSIIENNMGKKILIVGHSTSISFLFCKWCEVNYDGDYKFKNQIFFDGKWNYCQSFKLEFENDILTEIFEVTD